MLNLRRVIQSDKMRSDTPTTLNMPLITIYRKNKGGLIAMNLLLSCQN